MFSLQILAKSCYTVYCTIYTYTNVIPHNKQCGHHACITGMWDIIIQNPPREDHNYTKQGVKKLIFWVLSLMYKLINLVKDIISLHSASSQENTKSSARFHFINISSCFRFVAANTYLSQSVFSVISFSNYLIGYSVATPPNVQYV